MSKLKPGGMAIVKSVKNPEVAENIGRYVETVRRLGVGINTIGARNFRVEPGEEVWLVQANYPLKIKQVMGTPGGVPLYTRITESHIAACRAGDLMPIDPDALVRDTILYLPEPEGLTCPSSS